MEIYKLKGMRQVVEPGDLVVATRTIGPIMVYEHHAIYIGNGKIIHFADNKVLSTTLTDFSGDGDDMYIWDYGDLTRFSRSDIVKNAKSMLQQNGYNLFDHNCEHFATWCVTGESVSSQLSAATGRVLFIGAAIIPAVIAVSLPVSWPLMSLVGGVAGLGAAIFAMSGGRSKGRNFE